MEDSTAVTDCRLDELECESLVLDVGLINADLNCHGVKHAQDHTAGRLRAFMRDKVTRTRLSHCLRHSAYHRVVALGKLVTLMCLCHQAV